MRVAIASTGLGHVNRGIETWAADVFRALTLRGISATLWKGGGVAESGLDRVVPCWQRGAGKAKRFGRVVPHPVAWRMGLGTPYEIEQSTFALHLLPHLRRERIDILHVQDPQLAILVQRARKLGLVRTRVILGHGTEESLGFLRKIDYLQHLAPWHLEEARRAGVWKPTWTAIPNFIDTDRFTPEGANLRHELGIPPDAVVVLTAAAIKRSHKRIDFLLQEFARLRSARPELPVWLVVAGGWETETDELLRLGQQTLGDRVRFLVRFPRERMADLYRSADLFVLCSLKEMMPIALLEATGSGLPCLVHRHPIMEWIVGPGGEAIDMAAEGVLAGAVARLADNRSRRLEVGQEARRHCVANFSRDRVVDQILDYYRFVLSYDRTGRPAPAAT